MASYGFDIYIVQLNESPVAELPRGVKATILKMSAPFSNFAENKKLYQIFDNYDIVVFHSLQLPVTTKIAMSLFHPQCLKKIVWIEWGYDLYIEKGPGVKGKIAYQIKKIILKIFEKRIPYFVAIHPADIDAYKELVNGRAKVFFALYRGNNDVKPALVDYKKTSMLSKIKNGEPIYIQVNHRADRILNHKEILDRLSIYKEDNIKVFIPLCYGDRDYGDEVEGYAKALFGDKAICPRNVMAYDEYMDYLKRVDIFIMNSDRQVGLGNIHPMIRMQKKIYMPESSVLFRYFNKFGNGIQNVKMLGKENFSNLTRDVDISSLCNYVNEYLSVDSIQEWKKVFDQIIECHEGKKIRI